MFLSVSRRKRLFFDQNQLPTCTLVADLNAKHHFVVKLHIVLYSRVSDLPSLSNDFHYELVLSMLGVT